MTTRLPDQQTQQNSFGQARESVGMATGSVNAVEVSGDASVKKRKVAAVRS